MKRYLLICVVFAAIMGSGAQQAFAMGFGFYGMSGTGSSDWTDDSTLPKFTSNTEHKAFGISLDTGLSGRHFFNYHLNLGRETLTTKSFIARDSFGTPPIPVTGELELEGFVMTHTFGFGGELSDKIKMWIGPEIRWHFVKGSPSRESNFNLDGAGFGFGPSLGLNFNFPSGMTLLLKAGYIMSSYALDGSGTIGGFFASNTYDVDEKFTYIQLEFLFRSPGDR